MNIHKNNLILRQEKLASGNWIIGIAILCGKHTYVEKRELYKTGRGNRSISPRSQTKHLLRWITLLLFMAELLCLVLLIIISETKDDTFEAFLKVIASISCISPLFF
jgi:hypothetical protein